MNRLKLLIIFLAITTTVNAIAWEKYDKVLALINNKPVVESEVTQLLKTTRKRNTAFNKSRVLDTLIENQLVFATAEKESIKVSNKKIILQLKPFITKFFSSSYKKSSKLNKVVEDVSNNMAQLISAELSENVKINSHLKKFIKYIEKKERRSFRNFFETLRAKLAREQVMSIAIGASPPSKKQAKSWYYKNRRKLGFEIHAKHILIRAKNSSLSSEKAANDKIAKLRKRVRSGESFEKIARKYSQDRLSAARGGDLGWQIMAQMDPYFARNIYRMSKRGQISKVFKSRFGYHIVKFISKRAVSYDKVEKMIIYKLYTEGLEKQYKKWIVQEKRKSDIKIYMTNYIKG